MMMLVFAIGLLLIFNHVQRRARREEQRRIDAEWWDTVKHRMD